MDDLSGQTIKGYELKERLGAGGFGAVYKARQSTVGREVAIKVILPGFANQPDFIRRFETEAQLVARLEHLHITPLYDYWRDVDGAYLVMRYLRGGSLRDTLNEGVFNVETAGLMLDQIGSGLALAHRQAVIHRDLKPGNILLDEEGNFYLADFGIAKDTAQTSDEMTAADAVVGSLDYLSPEQARSEPVTPRTDIYSLGVVLYEVLTGEHPFKDSSSVERLYKHINDPLPHISDTLDPSILDAVNEVIQKATTKNPEHRYPDAVALAVAFRNAAGLAGRNVSEGVVEQLTQREQEILQLIVDGCPNREIADELYITLSTVKWHIRQIYTKLGVRSRVQAIVRARQLNLITSGDTSDFQLPDSPTVISLPEPENPYKGLYAFQAADTRDFFGRETLTQKLINRMKEEHHFQRFLAVVGPSGSGKSSVVKAGLIPALWRDELPSSKRWFVVDMIPGAHPLDELETALIRVAANQASNLDEQLKRDERGLLRVANIILPQDDTELVIVIDQFEEVFTLVENESLRQHFLNLLLAAVTDSRSRVRVIVTLRADYYDRPLHYPEFGEMVRQRMETILPLGAKELERAIRGPADRVGVTFEAGLVEQIVSEMTYQSGALPLLQYALTELFDRREGRLLTHTAYQGIGGAVGALANRADEVFHSLTEEAQSLTRQMFLRLVTLGEGAEDTRRRTPHSELMSLTNDTDLMEEIIDTFAAYRLLSLDSDPATRQPTVEVAHEAILREWEQLRAWLNDSREDIRQERLLAHATEQWHDHHHDKSYLLHGARLEQVEKWQQFTDLTLTPLENDYIVQSIQNREVEKQTEVQRAAKERALERRAQTVLRVLVAVFAIAAVVAGALSIFALDQRQTALVHAEQAEINAAEAQNVALVAGSQAALARGDTDTALALGWQVVELNPDSALAQAQLSEAAYSPGTVRRYVGHIEGVNDFAISPDEQTMISSSWDGTLILWDIQTGEILRQFTGHEGSVESVAFSSDGQFVVSGSRDTTAILWDVRTGEIIRRYDDYEYPIFTVDLSPDGEHIVANGEDFEGSIIQWDVETGDVMRMFEGHTNMVLETEFTPDGTGLLSGSVDDTLILWDVETGEIIHHMGIGVEDAMNTIRAIAISPDGTHALATDQNSEMVLWNLVDGTLVRRIKLDAWASSIDYMPDGQRAVVGIDDRNEVMLVDLQTGDQLIQLAGHTTSIPAIATIWNNRHVISASYDHTLRLWDLYSGQIIHHLDAPRQQYWEVDRTTDGRIALAASYDRTARLWDVETGEEIARFEDNQPIVAADFSRDGKYALFGTGFIFEEAEQGHIILWDVEAQEEIRRFVGHRLIVWDVEFSPDGRTAVSAGAEGALILWDVETGREIRRFEGYESDDTFTNGGMWDVTFSPDGKTIISAFAASPLILWDVETGEEIRKFLGHQAGAEGVVFSRDGQMMLSAGYDNTAILWDVASGEIIRHFTKHTGAVYQVQFTPDERFIMTGSGDDTTLLWDIETGEVVRRYYNMGAYFPAFSPDGRNAVITSHYDSVPELWRIDDTLDELLEWTQANRYIPELTCEQRDLYRVEPLCEGDN